jgi:signal transduction histidine kinase
MYLEKINDEKNLVLSQISHDLKQPLNTNIYLLDKVFYKCRNIREIDNHILKDLKFTICQHSYLKNLIQDILDYSRSERF